MIKVVMIPHNHEYIHRLKKSLKKQEIETCLLPPFHYATPVNFIKLLWLRIKGYKILHIHWLYVFPFTWFMKLVVWYSHVLGYKIVWTIHNILPHESTQYDLKKTRWFYNHVDYRFVHYHSSVEELKKVLKVKPENIEVIYHPTFEDSYPDKIDQQEARKQLNIPDNVNVILCFGLIRKYKGMEIFADAVADLGKHYLGLVVGNGKSPEVVSYLKEKQRKTPNLRIIDHYIPDDEVQLYFKAANVVVLPYLQITTSGVVLLAYSFKRPVITTRLGGMPEVVEEGKNGLLVSPGNVSDLQEAIKHIFALDYQRMGEEAQKIARKKFSWERLAEQTVKVYKKLIV